MRTTRLRSFTLPELLVVMIITAIVVGLAFSVLSLIQKEVHTIKNNFNKTNELALFEQRLWQDFNKHNSIRYSANHITMDSDIDTVNYTFDTNFVRINTDTLYLRLNIIGAFYNGKKIQSGVIDAISISALAELPDYTFFIFSDQDATQNMNNDGF